MKKIVLVLFRMKIVVPHNFFFVVCNLNIKKELEITSPF